MISPSSVLGVRQTCVYWLVDLSLLQLYWSGHLVLVPWVLSLSSQYLPFALVCLALASIVKYCSILWLPKLSCFMDFFLAPGCDLGLGLAGFWSGLGGWSVCVGCVLVCVVCVAMCLV